MASGASSEYGATSGASTEIPPAAPKSQVQFQSTAKNYTQSVADTIHKGRTLRVQKTAMQKRSARPPPIPAIPRGLIATDRDVKMTRRTMRRQAKCLRRHNIVLSDRMDELSKPTRRQLLNMWRTYADILTPEQIINLQTMLDASDPFKPDQAYEYFLNLRRQKKKSEDKEKIGGGGGKKETKKDLSALCGDRRFAWARSATVAFARGIQQRLSRPGNFKLEDGMLRLSDIVLDEMCSYSKLRPPSRQSKNPKAKFMVEMADKIAVWIDEILEESDERMLMMDFDEDDVVKHADEPIVDDFLNMMGGKGRPKTARKDAAYLKFTGDMLDAFLALVGAMEKKGSENLIKHGKFSQTYQEGAEELKTTPDLNGVDYNCEVANDIAGKMTDITKEDAVGRLKEPMKDIIDICSKYLAQYAEYNKDKGPAFRYLLEKMWKQPNEILCTKGKITKTMGDGAEDLNAAKGLETDHDDPQLTETIHSALDKITKDHPPELKDEMPETLKLASEYLSQKTSDDSERGPVFDNLITILEKHGGKPFAPNNPPLFTAFDAAYSLKTAPGLTSIKPDPALSPTFNTTLHNIADPETESSQTAEMSDVINRAADYLSGLARDRAAAQALMVKMMNKDRSKEAAKRNNVPMTYGQGADEFTESPVMTPLLPVKDISQEVNTTVSKDMKEITPDELKGAMKVVVKDAGGDMSQDVALMSGAAGDRYGRNLIAAAADVKGDEQLFKHGPYGMTHAEAGDTLRNAGTLEKSSKPDAVPLAENINTGLKHALENKVPGATAERLQPATKAAADHLAKIGSEKSAALSYLMDIMMTKSADNLENIQGIPHTYGDCVKKIAVAPSLANEHVDSQLHVSIRSKLNDLMAKNPNPEHESIMPGLVDDVAKFLAKPRPDSELERKQLLHDLLKLKGSSIFLVDGKYKMTYSQAGDEVEKTPTGIAQKAAAGGPGAPPPVDQDKQKDIRNKLEKSIDEKVPDKVLKDKMKGELDDETYHLGEVGTGRGQAMTAIHKELEKKGEPTIAQYKDGSMTYGEGAQTIDNAKNFEKKPSPPGLSEDVNKKIEALPVETNTASGDKHKQSTMKLVADSIAAETGRRGGYEPPPGSEGYKPGSSGAGAVGAGGAGAVGAGGAGGAGAGGAGAGGAGADGTGAGGAGGLGAGGLGAGGLGVGGAGADGLGAGGAGAGGAGAGGAGAGGAGAGGAGAGGAGAGGAGAGGAGAGGAGGLGAGGAGAGGAGAGGLGAGGAGAGGGGAGAGGLSDAEAAEAAAAAERARRLAAGERRGAQDKEHEDAKRKLIESLKKNGTDLFHGQSQVTLYNSGAADVLVKDSVDVDKGIRDSPDTDKLAKKFERKLSSVVGPTPEPLRDAMNDVIVESARPLAEHFVSESYATAVKDGLIDAMQRKDNELLVDENGDTETFFYTAQRLKKAKALTSRDPHGRLAREINKKLDDCVRSRPVPRKLASYMKDHTKHAADYLSERVLVRDPEIDAFVDLLVKMEDAGDQPLVVETSHKDAAAYLKTLTSFEDKIGKSDPALKDKIEKGMSSLMHSVPLEGYTADIRKNVITQQAGLLTSYLVAQAEKTNALKRLIERMEETPDSMVLRHGRERKLFLDAIEILRGKTMAEIQSEKDPDPVVARKIQIKLNNLMQSEANKIMYEVITDVSNYLAVHLLHPKVIKVCKCMKSKFIQCELWAEEILRHVARPRCTCSTNRIVQQQPSYSSGTQINFKECPTMATKSQDVRGPIPCPATDAVCPAATTSYMVLTDQHYQPARHFSPPSTPSDQYRSSEATPGSQLATNFATMGQLSSTGLSSLIQGTSRNLDAASSLFNSDFMLPSTPTNVRSRTRFQQSPWTMFAARVDSRVRDVTPSLFNKPLSDEVGHGRQYEQKDVPLMKTTSEMSDLYAMVLSLTWNVQAWRDWLQDNFDYALSEHTYDPTIPPGVAYQEWMAFKKRVLTEALQWRQYMKFSMQLTLRLEQRYTEEVFERIQETSEAQSYLKCQREMLEISDMFGKWTQWFMAVCKETEKLEPDPNDETPLHILCWNYLKTKVWSGLRDWNIYRKHLNIFWEHKYTALMTAWERKGPVWVMGAYGAVPSGAVTAGKYDDEVTWVARTTYNSEVLPGALVPSKHYCLVYANGAVVNCTKYQVLCNASVHWLPWRAGMSHSSAVQAVCVAPGVYVGRVNYHGHHLVGAVSAPTNCCNVVIHNRSYNYNSYELLVLVPERDI